MSVRGDETFFVAKRSILDTPFVSSVSRRAEYATHTVSSTTSLYRIVSSNQGHFREVAKIHWTGFGSLAGDQATTSRQSCIVRKQEDGSDTLPIPVSQWLTIPRRLFKNGTFKFKPLRYSDPEAECKWSSDTRKGMDFIMLEGKEPRNNHDMMTNVSTHLLVFACELQPVSTTLDSGDRGKDALAYFVPPYPGTLRPQLKVLEAGQAIIEDIVLSSLLIWSKKDDWKSAQSEGLFPSLSLSPILHRRGTDNSQQASGHNSVPSSSRRTRTNSSPHAMMAPMYGSWDMRVGMPPPYTSSVDVAASNRGEIEYPNSGTSEPTSSAS